MFLIIDTETSEAKLANTIKEAALKTGIPYDNLAYQFSRKKNEVFESDGQHIRKVEDEHEAIRFYFEYAVKPKNKAEYLDTLVLPDGSKLEMYYEQGDFKANQ